MSKIYFLSATNSLATRPQAPLGLLTRVGETLAQWQARARERHELATLDERALHDIGLTRGDIESETAKPFWRA